MSLYKTFGTDTDLETKGVWCEFPTNEDGTVPGFLLARMSSTNPKYQKAIEQIAKKHKQEIELDILSEATAKPVMLAVFLDHILLDWRNVQTEAGKNLPFNRANAEKLMKELPDLYTVLQDFAKRLSNYRKAEVERAGEA